MDTDLIIAVFQLAERERIIEVLCISRVDGECQYVAEVAALCYVISCDL